MLGRCKECKEFKEIIDGVCDECTIYLRKNVKKTLNMNR